VLEEGMVRSLFGGGAERVLELSKRLESIATTVTPDTFATSGFNETLGELGEIAMLHGYQMTVVVVNHGSSTTVRLGVKKMWDVSTAH
jgi:hypothetical protein